MATEVDRSMCGFPEGAEAVSLPQVLNHGSVSFGRYAVESLAWEKRSAFTYDRRQEELEKLKAPGLVAKKKAYFEEYYKKLRTMKSRQVSDKTSVDGVEAEVSARLSDLTVQENGVERETGVDENAPEPVPQEDGPVLEWESMGGDDEEKKDVEDNHDTQYSIHLNGDSDSRIAVDVPSIQDYISACAVTENPSSSLLTKVEQTEKSVAVVSCQGSIRQGKKSINGKVASGTSTRKNKPFYKIGEKNSLPSVKEPRKRPVKDNNYSDRKNIQGKYPSTRYHPAMHKSKTPPEIKRERSPNRVLRAQTSKPVGASVTRAATGNHSRKQVSSQLPDRPGIVKKARQELKPWR